MKAGVYVRISQDRSGAELGVHRQEEDCRALADRLGWDVIEVYCDNDVSAFGGKDRPAYRRMLEDVQSKRIRALAVYDVDRLTRQPKELEGFIDLVEAAGTRLASVSGEIDLGNASGRLHARVVGAFARHESERKAERIRRKHLELARDGKPSGAGARAFGYERDGITVREDEAHLLRTAAARVLTGDSLRSIVVEWNGQGVRTPRGNEWRSNSLRQSLLAPRIAGRRMYNGEPTAVAVWPALIDFDDWLRVRALLTDPRRGRTAPPRRYLLSGGLLVCDHCGGRLFSRPRSNGKRGYTCASNGNGKGGGCGKRNVAAEPLEELIVAMVLEALDTPELPRRVAEAATPAAGDVAEHDRILRDSEARLIEVGQDYDDGTITRAEYLARRDRLQERADAARAALTRRPELSPLPTGQPLREVWPALTLERQRAVIASVVDRIVVHEGTRGANRFDPDRITVEWKY